MEGKSQYINKNSWSTGNQTTWTWSGWVTDPKQVNGCWWICSMFFGGPIQWTNGQQTHIALMEVLEGLKLTIIVYSLQWVIIHN